MDPKKKKRKFKLAVYKTTRLFALSMIIATWKIDCLSLPLPTLCCS